MDDWDVGEIHTCGEQECFAPWMSLGVPDERVMKMFDDGIGTCTNRISHAYKHVILASHPCCLKEKGE